MAIVTKVEQLDRDIRLLQDESLSASTRSNMFAKYAISAREEVKELNKRILGRVPPYKTWVDSVEGSSEFAVSVNGTIVYEFQVIADVLLFIGRQLEISSPYLSGDYQRSHTIYADGVEIELGGKIPDAVEFVFLSDLPYASKIEHGQSAKAPNGVYEITANQAKKRFGNVATIEFNYRSTFTGTTTPAAKNTQTALHQNKSKNRFPAIIVRIGKS